MQAITKIVRNDWTKRMFQEGLDGRLRSGPTSDDNLRLRGLEAKANDDQDFKWLLNEMEQAAGREDSNFVYAVLDVDGMAKINERYGRQIGDSIIYELRQVT